jgi:hypothetical protein
VMKHVTHHTDVTRHRCHVTYPPTHPRSHSHRLTSTEDERAAHAAMVVSLLLQCVCAAPAATSSASTSISGALTHTLSARPSAVWMEAMLELMSTVLMPISL